MTLTNFVGLDVHKDSIAISVAHDDEAPRDLGIIPSDPLRLLKKLDKLGPRDSIKCCYEAGPTGYGLYRRLEAASIKCLVVAPSLVPGKPGDRVKTDRRDASKLARYLRSGDLTPVWVPDGSTEALRDLVRARYAATRELMAARHRLSKFLLRHERKYTSGSSWTGKHLEWIRKQKFEHQAQGHVLRETLMTVEESGARIARYDSQIEEEARASSLWPLVHALQALKGVQLLTAASIASELGELKRFDSARRLMAYVGLVCSEYSSGMTTRRGTITKTGNGNLRRIIIEAAWAYRHPPRKSRQLEKRTEGIDPEIKAIGWHAQDRLHRRLRRLLGRGKLPQVAITAVGRELLGFVWSIGQRVELSPQMNR
jgi:transposase